MADIGIVVVLYQFLNSDRDMNLIVLLLRNLCWK